MFHQVGPPCPVTASRATVTPVSYSASTSSHLQLHWLFAAICDKSPPPVLSALGFMGECPGQPQEGLPKLALGSPSASNTWGHRTPFDLAVTAGEGRNRCLRSCLPSPSPALFLGPCGRIESPPCLTQVFLCECFCLKYKIGMASARLISSERFLPAPISSSVAFVSSEA